jgi:hypothetical protein
MTSAEILDYEESMRDALIAQVNLAPMLYKAEADPESGRKAYARLDSQITSQQLHGVSQEVNSDGYVAVEGVDFNPQEWEQFKDQDAVAIAYARKLGTRAYDIVKNGLSEATGGWIEGDHYDWMRHGEWGNQQGTGWNGTDGASPTNRLAQYIAQNTDGAETTKLMSEFKSIKSGYGDDAPYYSREDVMIEGDPESNTYKEFVGKDKAGSLHRSGGLLQTIGGEQSSKFYNEDGLSENRQAGYSKAGEFQGTQKFEQDLRQREQRSTINNELGLVGEYGQEATDLYRQQGGIQDALDETERLGSMSAIPQNQSNDIFSLVDDPQPTMFAQNQQNLDNFDQGKAQEAYDLELEEFEAQTAKEEKEIIGRINSSGALGDPKDMRELAEFKKKTKILREKLEGRNSQSKKFEQPAGGYGDTSALNERMPEQGVNSSKSNQPSSRGLNQQMLAQAQEGMQAGGRLTSREMRTASQGARMATSARGRGRDFSGVLAELNFNEQASRARQTDRQNFAGQVMNTQMGLMDRSISNKQINDQSYQTGLAQDRGYAVQRVGVEQATSADPFQAILGRPSGVSNEAGQSTYGNAYAGVNASPQIYNPSQGAEFKANQASELNSYNAQMARAKAEEKSGINQMFGNIIGGGVSGLVSGWASNRNSRPQY